jgi:uncharacterized protein
LREERVRIMFAGAKVLMAIRTPSPLPAAEFSIPVHDLDAGGREFMLPVRAAWLRGVLEDTDIGPSTKDGELRVRLSKSGADVVLRGSVAAEITVPCSRCLEPTPVTVKEELSLLAVPASPSRPGPPGQRARGTGRARRDDDRTDETADPEESDVMTYDGDTLVLDGLVRDELLLGIPMIPLCSEACPGISPKLDDRAEAAGVDPRLRPLLELKKKT